MDTNQFLNIVNENVLIQKFSQTDFEVSKSKLLDRYQIWQGLLISNDEKSVITPDDLEHFREQAKEILAQKVQSDYELEQLKILTVLIYLLIDANKTALPGKNHIIDKQLAIQNLPNANHYIIRKIIYTSTELSLPDIERLVKYENLVLSSYHDEKNQADNSARAIEDLKSQDGYIFKLIDHTHKISFEPITPEIADESPTITETRPEPAAAPVGESLPAIILNDNHLERLAETMQTTTLKDGVQVCAASYSGFLRPRNEDSIIIHPTHNQVTVVDAMGGYGNGIITRDIFVDTLLRFPGDIATTVKTAQHAFDENDVPEGGVCLIDIMIKEQNGYQTITLGQAGDVRAILYDETGTMHHETRDEAIGHQVLNAIISHKLTLNQRANGWSSFGELTYTQLNAKSGWRLIVCSDGISNHFDAMQLASMLSDTPSEQAMHSISEAVATAMEEKNAYRDNTSIVIIDF